jgi:signal transduction histidine kinase
VLEYGAMRGFPGEWNRAYDRMPLDASTPLADAVRTGTPVYLESHADWEVRYPALAAEHRRGGFEAAAALPCATGDRVVGGLALSVRGPRAFTADERALLLALAQQGAAAFVRATAYAEAEAARRAAEQARVEADLERRRLLTVLEQLPVGVHVAEAPSGRLLLDNAAVRAICGEAPRSGGVAAYSADYAGHYPAGHPLAGQALASDAWPMAQALATGAPVGEQRVEIRRADGTRRLVGVSAAPVHDADGRLVGAVATSVDVTEREQLVAAERAARAEAEAANRAKSQFLAVMSHELRTPLNAIGGYAELMEMGIRGPVTAEQREDLSRIQRSQRHLLGLVNEVLNHAKLETGAVHYELTTVPAHDALAGAEALVAPQASAKALALVVTECPAELAVRADAEKLRQVLVNLASNAVKFTDRGGRVVLACAPAGAQVAFTVRDTGIGIPADKLDAIFDPFVQVRGDLTRPHEGTGLGLAISRDLARGMGGDLTAESTPGVGSTFTVTLPAVASTTT